MKTKQLIDSHLRRMVPESFGWVDHRLVRDGLIKKCGRDALALYLFLITVSDADGLSYYSDEKTQFLLGMSRKELEEARRELLKAGWILWDGRLYQVINLVPASRNTAAPQRRGHGGDARSLKDILTEMMGGVEHD